MTPDSDLLNDRLSELVASLSGNSHMIARVAIDQVVKDADPLRAEPDALHHVASALVHLRRTDQRELLGAVG